MPFPSTNPALARALDARGYQDPTPVQAAVLEAVAADRDLLVSAQTGSGKTVAYGLAFAPTLLGEDERFGRAMEPLTLVIAPTRELAMQVERELAWLYAETGARIVSCIGGMDARREARLLANGCHIVVGTPGRLRDHLERGQLDSSHLKVVVLDEADEMLDLGFRDDLEFILDQAPAGRRTLLFSATFARDILDLTKNYQRDAHRIDTQVRNQPHADIDYRAVRIAPNEIQHAVVNVLRYFDSRATLVFCSTREAVRHLHASLLERGFTAVALSGELSQNERTHALQSVREGRASVCIATDVAARGIDLPDLGLVIHADLPLNKETLLHRSGRTGRAGRKGICVLLVPYTRRRRAEQLLTWAKLEATWGGPPTADEVRAKDQQRMLNDPLLTDAPSEEDLVQARALMAGRTPEEIAAALIRLYRARLPAPEELYDGGPAHHDRRSQPRGEGRPESGPRRANDGPMSWFRLGVGRHKNADPKWLVPLICRLGHVTKRDIGAIRIFDRETKFEIAADVAARFAEAVAQSAEDEIRIEPTGAAHDDGGSRPPFRKAGPRPGDKRPYDKAGQDSGAPSRKPKFKERPKREA